MTYMENAHLSYTIQKLENGHWINVSENVGLQGFLIYLQREGGNPNYRAIAQDGSIAPNPHKLLQEVD